MNYIGAGHQSLKGSFQAIAQRDYSTLNALRFGGGLLIFVGALTTLPMGAAMSGPGIAAAAIGSIGLAYKTIETAKPKRAGSSRERDSSYDEEI